MANLIKPQLEALAPANMRRAMGVSLVVPVAPLPVGREEQKALWPESAAPADPQRVGQVTAT